MNSFQRTVTKPDDREHAGMFLKRQPAASTLHEAAVNTAVTAWPLRTVCELSPAVALRTSAGCPAQVLLCNLQLAANDPVSLQCHLPRGHFQGQSPPLPFSPSWSAQWFRVLLLLDGHFEGGEVAKNLDPKPMLSPSQKGKGSRRLFSVSLV